MLGVTIDTRPYGVMYTLLGVTRYLTQPFAKEVWRREIDLKKIYPQ